MPPLSISVIVPTKDRVGSLHELLQSLAQCDPLPNEAVVVDDGSAVHLDAAELQKAVPFRLLILRNDTSVGPGAARNRGVHASRGALLLFTDDDCTVDRSWIGTMASELEAGDEQLGGVGGRVLARDGDAARPGGLPRARRRAQLRLPEGVPRWGDVPMA